MGSQQSVVVANAFPQDIWVRAGSKRITDHLEVSDLQMNFNIAAKKEIKTSHEALINEGFTKMPKQKVSTFNPLSSHTKTVTVIYYDANNNMQLISEDTPHSESHTVIVTATGGIVDAKDRCSPWIDLNNIDHKQEPCPVCSHLLSVCSICLLVSRLAEISYSIGVVRDGQLTRLIAHTIERVRSVAKKQNETQEMMAELENLASMFWELESKTKRAVGNVRVYGIELEEAAQDFLEDSTWSDFCKKWSNITESKENLMRANAHHMQIKGEVMRIEEKAKSEAGEFEEGCLTSAGECLDAPGAAPSITIGQRVAGLIARNLCKDSAIGTQMGLVEIHFTKIIRALHDIEQCLNKWKRSEEDALSALSKEKRKTMVSRVIEKTGQLREACDHYFSIVDDNIVDT